MTKDATLDRGRFADRAIGIVDRIRRRVHGRLETQQFRVYVVTRRWSGDKLGLGTPKDDIFELDPRPSVELTTSARSSPGGREDTTDAKLTGVSLRYTMAELTGSGDARTETFYRVEDARGQGQGRLYFALAARPTPRRGANPGDALDWVVSLKTVQPPSPTDVVG